MDHSIANQLVQLSSLISTNPSSKVLTQTEKESKLFTQQPWSRKQSQKRSISETLTVPTTSFSFLGLPMPQMPESHLPFYGNVKDLKEIKEGKDIKEDEKRVKKVKTSDEKVLVKMDHISSQHPTTLSKKTENVSGTKNEQSYYLYKRIHSPPFTWKRKKEKWILPVRIF